TYSTDFPTKSEYQTYQGGMDAFVVKITPDGPPLHHIIIRDAQGGGGDEVGTHTMTTDETLTVFAAGYDADNNYIGDIEVTWTGTGVVEGNLSPTTGTSTTFSPTTTGTGTIHADDGAGHTDDTGIIIVGIFIDDSKGGLAESPDGNTKLKFGPNSLGENVWVIIDPNPIGDIPSGPTGYYRIGDSIVEIKVYNSAGAPITDFNNPVTLILHYPDVDQDGIVDGSLPPIHELSLKVFKLINGAWVEMPGSKVDPEVNTVSVPLTHLSVYILMGQPGAAAKLDKVVVYPNPFKPDKGHTVITFGHPTDLTKRLTAKATIQIYNVSGELVKTIKEPDDDRVADGVATWDATNDKGEKVASGIYIYYITNPNGEKCVGKIGIIK
ncbi:MAG: T9SS type A sorting domain-containing protein, partial [bacterium]|nr:T9SS type A sorting domain-containing protein [bacterium]